MSAHDEFKRHLQGDPIDREAERRDGLNITTQYPEKTYVGKDTTVADLQRELAAMTKERDALRNTVQILQQALDHAKEPRSKIRYPSLGEPWRG